MKRLLPVMPLILLAACVDNVSVQSRYNQERDTCRGEAEERFTDALGDQADGMDSRARNTELATLFSQCMGSRGWTVATPSKKPDQVADNRPFPGQTMPPPVQAARVMPPPAPLPYGPYGAPPPGYAAQPMLMTAPPPGAILMAPPPGAVPIAPVPVPLQQRSVQAVPQPAPVPNTVRRRSRGLIAAPPPSTGEEDPRTAQELLDQQLQNPESRP